MELLNLAERIEAYNPKTSPDNRADELALHQDVVMLTGIGTLSPEFDATFLRSLDAAMTLVELVKSGWGRPANLVIAAFYGSAYIVPCDGESYGINDPLKGEARVAGDGVSTERTARTVTAACLRAIATSEVTHG